MTSRRIADEHGASAAEYGLLVSGIAAVIVAAVFAFGGTAQEVTLDNCEHIASATSIISGSCR